MTGVQFPDDVVGAIAASLPKDTDPMRSALLPEILRAWAIEDLREHLSREGRAALLQRQKRLRAVGAQAQALARTILALDEHDRFTTILRTQMHHGGTSVLMTDIAAAGQRFAGAVSWLADLVEVFHSAADEAGDGKEPKPPPDKSIRHYLIVRDLASIFELVTRKPATRRIVFASGQDYGPFADFVEKIWAQIFENKRGLSYAIRVWANELARQQKLIDGEVAKATSQLSRPLDDVERDTIESRFREYSPFVANLGFRHPDLWRKLSGTPR